MILILLFTSLFAFAQEPIHWANLLKLSERHEFYKDHEAILSPKDSWQSLFSVIYVDSELSRLKDCIFFKVPGADLGILKIKTVSANVNCEDYLLQPGDKEVPEVTSLQYSITDSKFTIDISLKDYRTEKWLGSFQGTFQKPVPKMAMSSAEFKSPTLILLAPKSTVKSPMKKDFLKKGTLCHNINEDCEQVSVQICDECQEGWYEVPNGCAVGPKYCGRQNCGGKDQPACRRGMTWQRKEEAFECRMDSTFAYCSKGLTVQCDGKKAFCR
jgi:hypothetical protein